MITDTLTTIENQFFDGLKAVQEPTVEAARKAAELLAGLPVPDQAASLASRLPSAEDVVAHNFDFVQRLVQVQRDYALELAGITAAAAPAKPAGKKSAA